MSFTPRNCDLKALTLALKDSAPALFLGHVEMYYFDSLKGLSVVIPAISGAVAKLGRVTGHRKAFLEEDVSKNHYLCIYEHYTVSLPFRLQHLYKKDVNQPTKRRIALPFHMETTQGKKLPFA